MSKEISNQSFSLEPKNFSEALEYAKMIADSDLVPKDYKGKPGNVLVAMQYGVEIGLKPLQALQNIAVINGRPTIWGDSVLALVQASGLCERFHEEIKGDTSYCFVKRKGQEESVKTFSVGDAKKANLWGKAGPWTQYPERMLQMRARAFALRDNFADVLKGLQVREEVEDYQTIDIPNDEKKSSAQDKINALLEKKSMDNDLAFVNQMIRAFERIGVYPTEIEKELGIAISCVGKNELDKLREMYKERRNTYVENNNHKTGIEDIGYGSQSGEEAH